MNRLVKKVVKRISEGVSVDKIILFGSRATKKFQPESDIDLLLIYNGPLSKSEVQLQVRHLFSLNEYDFGLDLFVLSSDEFERQKKVVGTLGRIISQEGTVCYER